MTGRNRLRLSSVFKQAFVAFRNDHASRSAAALAYYMIFSIVPMFLIAIAIAGMVFGKQAAQGEILGQLGGVLGEAAANAIQEMVKNAARPKAGLIAATVGVITFLFGAAGVLIELKDAFNTIWKVKRKKSTGTLSIVKKEFLSISIVLAVGFVLVVLLAFDAAIAAMGKYASNNLRGEVLLWQPIQLVVSIAVATALFAAIFRFVPESNVEWRDVWLGAAFTGFLFVFGKLALALYLGQAAVGSSYGVAGSLIVVLVWVYWSVHIFLFGAEFTHAYATADGLTPYSADINASINERQAPGPSLTT